MTEADHSSHSPSLIEWHAASRPYPGYSVSGDLHLVRPYPGGVLVAVMDGLGHGEGATVAAKAAADVLEAHTGESLEPLVKRCHEALRRTRGVAMSLVTFAPGGTMNWIGVGNVEGFMLRGDPNGRPLREGLVQRGGVVGYQLPPLRVNELSVSAGDTLFLATDGIKSRFMEGVGPGDAPQAAAERLLEDYGKDTDDSLVLVARYVGDG